MVGTKRKIGNTSRKVVVQKNPTSSDIKQTFVNNSLSGNVKIPRRIVPTNPISNNLIVIKAFEYFNLVGSAGGTNPFNNVSFYANIYNVRNGIITVWPGKTMLSSLYDLFVVIKFRIKLTVINNLDEPIWVSLVRTKSLVGSGQSTLQTSYLLPYATRTTLGGYRSGSNKVTLTQSANISSLYGYDVSTNWSYHSQSFSSNPVYNVAGFEFQFCSVDGSTSPSVSVTAHYELETIGILPRQVVS